MLEALLSTVIGIGSLTRIGVCYRSVGSTGALVGTVYPLFAVGLDGSLRARLQGRYQLVGGRSDCFDDGVETRIASLGTITVRDDRSAIDDRRSQAVSPVLRSVGIESATELGGGTAAGRSLGYSIRVRIHYALVYIRPRPALK
ncbi:hypothetical protein JMJ58_02000 [Haloterrigena salifodinae]|uniref:Uncharacterized protein n=1 Tax=Haloterrigena salifodinae TaxID=2675099 RepID=A0A8T8E1P2_9EURY|nr:hypothetical protein [Haloterrigena salifodinae]QRV15698.1 hypothetical protein JMJ58_02000 [Haloterrigena salifodinae]